MRKSAIGLVIVLLLLTGAIASAASDSSVFLPFVSNGLDTAGDPQQAQAYLPKIIETVPINNERLIVLTLSNDSNFVAYVYDKYGAQTFIDGWTISGIPASIDIAGCLWVTAMSEYGTISVHKVNLPLDSVCE